MHLTGFLESLGLAVEQRDLSAAVLREILTEYGDETTDELLELLAGAAPAAAKRGASAAIEELALAIRDRIDGEFGFSRYAEAPCRRMTSFAVLERLVRRRGVLDRPLRHQLDAAMAAVRPTLVGVTCPFPGTLVAAFKIARHLKRRYPGVKVVLGGGYVSTELRGRLNPRVRKYFDRIILDSGYVPLARMLGVRGELAEPAFVRPSYRGIDWSEYFDVVETDNPVLNLWNSGRWVKLMMARGCYWHRCAFCDVRLEYIGRPRQPRAVEIVEAMTALGNGARGMGNRFHFVDEAMPPKLVREVAAEIVRRGYVCEWWGNIRFDAAFTPELSRLMAKSGCVAVSGGLECADDRLLKLMNKGITLASATKVLEAFKAAGIAVHAYLMYGFPTETAAEERAARRYVASLARRRLVASVFWHRFALTVHSPIAAAADRFGIVPRPEESDFAVNELDYS